MQETVSVVFVFMKRFLSRSITVEKEGIINESIYYRDGRAGRHVCGSH